MTNANHEPWRPELLAGYADGELSANERAAVETRLSANPADKDELSAQHALSRGNTAFWQRVAVPVPGPAAWHEVRVGIADGLIPATPSTGYKTPDTGELRSLRSRRNSLRLMSGWIATAALVVAAVFYWPGAGPESGPNDGADGAGEAVFELARADDVDIISVQGDDFGMIVVGNLPLGGVIEIATVGDVSIDALTNDPDGRGKKTIIASDPNKPIWYSPIEKTTPVAP